jgi:enoyl-CoA hydratase/carnithine racemase
MPPARLGVVYSDTGLRRFVDAIGAARTRELFLTARPVATEEALGWGLVNEVVTPAAVAARGVELASQIAALSPLSVRGTKRVLRALAPPLEPAVAAELHALRDAAFRSEDFAEGVRAFTEKRQPRWRGT